MSPFHTHCSHYLPVLAARDAFLSFPCRVSSVAFRFPAARVTRVTPTIARPLVVRRSLPEEPASAENSK